MRAIIAGSRKYSLPVAIELVYETVETFESVHGPIDEVVYGCADGIDAAAEVFANSRKLPSRKFVAEWKDLGLAAGPVRNGRMASYARDARGALILIWDGKSKGSKNMKATAE